MEQQSPEIIHQRRHLDWPRCLNARDLGGLPLPGGGTTAWRTVIRSDMLSRLNATGKRALIDYGIRTIIDLRSKPEVAAEAAAFDDASRRRHGLSYFNLQLETYEPAVSALIQAAQSRAEVYCIILDHYPAQMARVIETIAAAPAGGVLIHCHAGKDRTGTVVALLLQLAGVADQHIIADYALSQSRLAPLHEGVETAEGASFWERPTATPAVMATMLKHLDRVHGGAAAYLARAGVSAATLTLLRRRLGAHL